MSGTRTEIASSGPSGSHANSGARPANASSTTNTESAIPARTPKATVTSSLARGADLDDPVSASVTRRHEQRAIGRRGYGTKASIFLVEKDPALRHVRGVHAEP